MFYAHFVLSKKGPLARIWLAAHWDKKLTKAHVFETNIDSSVEAIIEPKVKMALRTSGHLLLGVVRIYSRKAKYLLADCNEAFVKIKMAFRPGVVDMPEENREAAAATITLPETFHDFDTTMADLTDIDVQAQFSVNQSRPEEITMREEMGNITLVGDEGFGPGDLGFDEKTIIQDVHMDNTLYKTPSHQANITFDNSDTVKEPQGEKTMDIDLPKDDGFGDAGLPDFDDDGPAGCDDDDVSDQDNDFGGDMDPNLFDDDFGAGLFEEQPEIPVIVPEPPPQQPDKLQKDPEELADNTAQSTILPEQTTLHTDQTTLVPNESEAFALEPLDVTSMGTERKAKRKRKLVVDEQKGIASETMKMQLSDTSEIVTTLDLAPPTKKLMHWKETGGVEKLFALPGRPIVSKRMNKLFNNNLITRPMKHDKEDVDLRDTLELTDTEAARDDNETLREQEAALQPPMEAPSLVMEDMSVSKSHIEPPLEETPSMIEPSIIEPSIIEPSGPSMPDTSLATPAPDTSLAAPAEVSLPVPEIPVAELEATRQQDLDEEDDIFNDMLPDEPLVEEQAEQDYEDKRWGKRTQQLIHILDRTLQFGADASFHEVVSRNNRKQVASKFYTLLVLKKQQAVEVEQIEPYGDILIKKGPMYGAVMA